MRCFFFALIAAIGFGALAQEIMPVETLALGAKAPAFSLPGIDGKEHTLEDFKAAKVLVLVFTSIHCPTAQAYEDRVQQLHDDYKDKGVAVVAINPNDPLALRLDELGYSEYGDSFEDIQHRAKDKNITYPYLDDGSTQVVSRAYGPVSTPHVFIFDAERTLRYRGRIDDAENAAKVTVHDARNAIDALLAGKEPPVTETRSTGCSTKWSEKRDSVKEALKRWEKEEVTVGVLDGEGLAKLLKNEGEDLRLVNFYATWCGPCIAEFPDLVDINRMYRMRDFELVTVSLDEQDAGKSVLKFLEKNHASTKNYHYTGGDEALFQVLGKEWDGGIPLTLLIAPGGKVIGRYSGLITPLTVKKDIVGQLGRTF